VVPHAIAGEPEDRGACCFYNERVDLFIDGKLQARPVTKFSKQTNLGVNRLPTFYKTSSVGHTEI